VKFLFGLIVGAVGVALYQSEAARAEFERRFGQSPDALVQSGLAQARRVGPLSQSVVGAASQGAQRVSEAIDAAPLPDAVKKPASEAAFNVWSTTESQRESADPNDVAKPESESAH
jgi:hypothetical protein